MDNLKISQCSQVVNGPIFGDRSSLTITVLQFIDQVEDIIELTVIHGQCLENKAPTSGSWALDNMMIPQCSQVVNSIVGHR